jgi:23S rRNA (adenine2503-C2)-methyltransferase
VLENNFCVDMDIEKSKDGTVKFNFPGGYAAVLIPLGRKKTLCLSSQVGCPMRCKFCLSGKKKFERNLSLEELKEQMDSVIKDLAIEDLNSRDNTRGKNLLGDNINTIVFMGMGEPMLNLDNVLKFCDYVNDFYNYAYSKICISTSGVLPGMERVIDNVNKIQLAVSLHSPFQEVRNKIMPGVSGFKIFDLIKMCERYNSKYRQKIMVEYVMIKGLNDRDEDLEALKDLNLCKKTNFNLIPLNSSFKLDDKMYTTSSEERIFF